MGWEQIDLEKRALIGISTSGMSPFWRVVNNTLPLHHYKLPINGKTVYASFVSGHKSEFCFSENCFSQMAGI